MSKEHYKLNGLHFAVSIHRDEDMGPPWKEHDGHGEVSDWTTRSKRPGERILSKDREFFRYYDMQASIQKALKEGWGVEDTTGKTKRQIAVEAVEADFEFLRRWCNDEWYWVYVRVELLSSDRSVSLGRVGYIATLGGIESDSEDYIKEVIRELAEEIAGRVNGQDQICIPIRIPPQATMDNVTV